jgi:hypothetical protein
MLLSLLEAARKLGVEVREAEVRAGRRMHTDLKTGVTRASHFFLDLYLDADIQEEQRQQIEELTRQGCASRATFLNPPEISERVHIGRPEPRE